MTSGVKISEDKKNKILNLWLQGYTYKIINQKTGVSPAAISGFIRAIVETQLDLSKLRELSLILKKSGASHLECIRGARFLEQLNALNVSLKDLDILLDFCRAIDNPVKAARAGLEMESIKERTGKTYMEILDESEAILTDRKLVTQQLKEERRDLKNTRGRLRAVKRLEQLQNNILRLGLTPERLQQFIEKSIQIEENGFTPEVSILLSRELKTLGLIPAKAVEKIVALISQSGSIIGSINNSLKEKTTLDESINYLKFDNIRLGIQNSQQKTTISTDQTRITKLKEEINQLETRYDQRMRTLDINYDVQVSFHKRQLRFVNQQIDETKTLKSLIEKDLEDLTSIKGTIEDYIDYSDKFRDKLEVQRILLKESHQKRIEINTEIKAKHDQLEAKDAWINYLVSGEIPNWDNIFWNDLGTLMRVRKGELPANTYLKPASKSVRETMINHYDKMVKDDIVSTRAHKKLQKENAQLQEQVRAEREGREDERGRKEFAKRLLTSQKQNLDRRVLEEVSNYLNYRIATMECQTCHNIFWVDRTVPYNKISYKCPYCLLTFNTDLLIYSLLYHSDKVVISAKLPDYIPQDFQVETSPKKVTIRSNDGMHHIEVPLKTYPKPSIVKQTYSGDTLKIIVKNDFEKPKPPPQIPDYIITRSPS